MNQRRNIYVQCLYKKRYGYSDPRLIRVITILAYLAQIDHSFFEKLGSLGSISDRCLSDSRFDPRLIRVSVKLWWNGTVRATSRIQEFHPKSWNNVFLLILICTFYVWRCYWLFIFCVKTQELHTHCIWLISRFNIYCT